MRCENGLEARSTILRPAASFAHEFVPLALQGALDADESGEEDVELTGFDLLHGAQVQVSEFGQPLLRQTFGGALAANVCPKPFELRLNFLGSSHALLSRKTALT